MLAPGKKIKILYLLDCLYGFGGTERHVYQLATRLDPDKFEAIVCPIRHGLEIIEIFKKAGIDVRPMMLKRVYDLPAAWQAVKLRHLLRSEKIDIVQSFNIDSDIYGTLLTKFSGTPVMIASRRDLGLYRESHHLKMTKFTNRYVKHFVAVCDAAGEVLARTENISPERITTIYNGIDSEDLPEVNDKAVAKIKEDCNITPDSFVVGKVAHFRPEKGHEVFFEAIHLVQAEIPNLRVLLVGEGETRRHWQKTIEEDGLADQVFFSGYIHNVFDYLSIFDVSCLTPVGNEGFSNALLEQMAMQKAIIATNVGGNAEALVDGESGIVIPPHNAEILAQSLLTLYKDSEYRTEMGKKARARVESHFSLDRMISRMESFYREMFANNSNGNV